MRRTILLSLFLISLMILFVIFTGRALSYSDIRENSWTTMEPMPTARAYLGIAVVNGKIYTIGGDVGSINGGGAYPGIIRSPPVVNINEEYDPITDTWTMKTPMPTARAQFGITTFQNKIFCIGGYLTKYESTNINEMYDPATNSWYTKAPMPSTAVEVQANAVDGKIYVIGSESNINYTYSAVNYVYTPATDSWTSKTPPPNEIANRYSAVVGNKIYFIGNLANLSHVIQTYDTLNDSWSIVGNAPIYPQSENGGGITSGMYAPKQIYFFDDKATNVFDPKNGNWTVGNPMPSDRLCAGVAVVGDIFYVIGGRSGRHDLITLMQATAETEQYVPIGYGTIHPVVSIISPESKTYNESNVPLTFTVDISVSSMEYSLDGQDNKTIAGNTTLTGLSFGQHNVTVYTVDFAGNVGSSKTITFTVAEPEGSPAVAIATVSLTIVVTAIGSLLIYLKKRAHRKNNTDSYFTRK